jgi:hypothetical protein
MPAGAHLLVQTRAQTLDGTLRGKFENWYPGLAGNDPEISSTTTTGAAACAALPKTRLCFNLGASWWACVECR